jgi:DNA polymerase-3 subunit gamma/tau
MVRAETIGALVRELALQAQLLTRGGADAPAETVWLLRVENGSLNQASTRERLQTALAQHGHAVRLQIEVGAVTDSPSRRLAAAAALQLNEAHGLVLQDPLVQAMMREFGGKIVPGSLKAITPAASLSPATSPRTHDGMG